MKKIYVFNIKLKKTIKHETFILLNPERIKRIKE